jgi:peptidoglycan L-alanyl-D-glutamate endopeptidase CwlK
MSRKIEDLTPETQEKFKEFAARMAEAGIPFMITCTYRSQSEQEVLYAQGRTTPGKIVTWTHHSRHTERTAFDIAILSEGKPIWSVKIDVNENDVPDYQEAASIGEMVGLTAGARWNNPDYPHFQNDEVT